MTIRYAPRSGLRYGGLLSCAAMLVAGCSPGDVADEGEDGQDQEAQGPAYPEGPFEREGASGQNRATESTLRIDAVERYDDRTVLKFTTIPSDEGSTIASDLYGGGILSEEPVGFRLLDPVGQSIYYPAREDGDVIGSSPPSNVIGGAEYHIEAHFPPVPEGTDRITVMTPGTQGAYTGIPVTEPDGERQVPTEEVPDHGNNVQPGEEVVAPVNDGEVDEDGAFPLAGVTEDEEIRRETSATHKEVQLDADVLFEFDEAELTPEASGILDEVVEETRSEADPEKPPVTITGHTDGKGSDDYNQELSEQRAAGVREYLEAELGTDYAYETEGKGAEEPVVEEGGSDDEEARARNRRVEISYNVKQVEVESEATTESEVTAGQADNAAPPAPFRADSGEPVGSAEGESTQGFEFTMDVMPFFRDGAYLVATLDLANESGKTINGATGASFHENGTPGGTFGSFGVVDPEAGTIYHAVRIEGLEDTEYVEPFAYPYRNDPGTTDRIHLYFPAPPAEVETVSFDAGEFGTFEDVPISE